MRQLYAILLFALTSLASQAQIVNIPDAAFKTKLLTYTPTIDTNSDGEIQVSEALTVTTLDLRNSYIWDSTGIAAFANLTSLDCSGSNSIENLDVSTMPNLQTLICKCSNILLPSVSNLVTLDCSQAMLSATGINMSSLTSNLTTLKLTGYPTTLNLTAFPNLKTLELGIMPLTSLDLSPLVNLKNLAISNNSTLTTVDLAPLVNLETLDFTYNRLTSFTFPALPNLKKVVWNQNQTTSFNPSALVNLTDLKFTGNFQLPLATIDFSPLTNLINLEFTSGGLTAMDVSNLTNLVTLDCSKNQLTTIDVSNLTNLTSFNCGYNQLAALDVSNLVNLTSLNCRSNLMNTIDVSNLVNLTSLNCASNLMNTVNFSNLVNLTSLVCNNNGFSTLDLSHVTALETLDCSNNNLTTLDLSNLVNMISLTCNNNQLTDLNIEDCVNLTKLIAYFNELTAIDFTNLTKLRIINLGGNLFTSIDLSHIIPSGDYPLHQTAMNLKYECSVSSNPNLVYLNVKNGVPIGQICGFGGACRPTLGITGCNNLLYLCIDDVNIPLVEDLLPITQVNAYCTAAPGGTYNTIVGTYSFDLDNNGCDAADYLIPNSKVKIDNGTIIGGTFTNDSGEYKFFRELGSYTISPEFENPYYTITPANAIITFADNNSNSQTQNFCVSLNGIHNDAEITLVSIDRPRPGFDASYYLVCKNKGNQTLSGNINFTFDDAVLDFISASPAVTSQTLNQLHWSYANLLPFEKRYIEIKLNVNAPTETPAVNIGDILNFTAAIDPVSGDETIPDNTFALTQTVQGSYDPNDKTCLEGDTLTTEMVGDYLHYLIRFQNSGTAAAENIVVKDMIDTTKFDVSSLQLTGSSHPQVTKITGNKVEFQFMDINLPAEIEDEAGSHGYIAFKIKTKSNLVIGDSVENKAEIYFDYNFPIITNTATSVVTPLLAVNLVENTSVVMAPNPTQSMVHISSKNNITSVQLFDVQGRILETFTANKAQVDLDLNQKTNGIYFIKIYTEKGMKVEKIIKE